VWGILSYGAAGKKSYPDGPAALESAVPATAAAQSETTHAFGWLSGPAGRFADAFKHPFPLLLCQLCVIVAAAALCGRLSRKLGQPAVIGEMAAGILLGPSLLGHLLPAWESFLFPASSMGALNLLSQVGIILFMFSVGMEIDLGGLRKHARTALFVSHAGIVAPFLLGMLAAACLFAEYAPVNAKFPAFALFMGIAMSITAFPVLARIIEERGLSGSRLGTTAMASAAVDDVTAWTLLAAVIAVARAESPVSIVPMAVLAAGFTAFMLFVVRPYAARALERSGQAERPGRGLASLVVIGVFLSAFATEAIGIHSLFGAFLAGAIMPASRPFRSFLRDRLEYAASLFLLPVFFAATGLRTRLDAMDQAGDWAVFAVLFALAVAGKLGGVTLSARLTGTPWRDALALGALMNTRGLMELIVLNVGLDLGILPPRIFTMMVLVALATTAMTGPLLTLLKVGRPGPRGGPD
jgi:Kef-type K+ transport system membrane component KefB